jgi:alpha-ribazole phosphatase
MIVLVRHGESLLGSQERFAGHSDTPLTPRGRRQLAKLRLPHVDRVYSSDLLRCRQSAQTLRLHAYFTPLLRELDFGAWEGRTHAELLRSMRYRKWLSDPHSTTPPKGESIRDMVNRVWRLVAHLRGRNLLITHAGPIWAVTGQHVPPGGMVQA